MTPTFELRDWPRTSRRLHEAVKLAGPINKALLSPRRAYLHLPLEVHPWGLESREYPGALRLRYLFGEAEVVLRKGAEDRIRLPLAGHTQAGLLDALVSGLEEHGAAGERDEAHPLLLPDELDELDDSELLVVDEATASAYARLEYAVFTGTARFRARLEGVMGPVVVWPHHFDLSTLWFPPSNAGMDEEGPHLSFGLAPFTPGQFERPYLYAYAHPLPDGLSPPSFADPLQWHEEGWKGAVVPFEALEMASEPAKLVEEAFLEVHRTLEPILGER